MGQQIRYTKTDMIFIFVLGIMVGAISAGGAVWIALVLASGTY